VLRAIRDICKLRKAERDDEEKLREAYNKAKISFEEYILQEDGKSRGIDERMDIL